MVQTAINITLIISDYSTHDSDRVINIIMALYAIKHALNKMKHYYY